MSGHAAGRESMNKASDDRSEDALEQRSTSRSATVCNWESGGVPPSGAADFDAASSGCCKSVEDIRTSLILEAAGRATF